MKAVSVFGIPVWSQEIILVQESGEGLPYLDDVRKMIEGRAWVWTFAAFKSDTTLFAKEIPNVVAGAVCCIL